VSLSRWKRLRYQTIIVVSVSLGILSLVGFNALMIWGLSKVISGLELTPIFIGMIASVLAGIQFYGMLDPCNSKIQAYKRKVGLR